MESLTDRQTSEIMPVLKNARHEKFAQARFGGKQQMRHTLLQVQTHRGNASRLRANENVVARYGAAISGRGRAAVSDARQPVY